MSALIKNGRIITSERDYVADVFINGETIASIGSNLSRDADITIDAKGKYVIPGGIDVHTHLDMPYNNTSSSDDFETGTRAAAFGGTTAIIDFATQSRGTSLCETLDTWQNKASGKACIDYGFHMIITDLTDTCLEEMDVMVREGVPTFKVFMAYPGRLMLSDTAIGKAMKRTAKNGGVICIHAEDGESIEPLISQALARGEIAPKFHALTRPAKFEAEAVKRSIGLAEANGVPVYIVHVSCDESLQLIANARKKGLPVYGETCPQYLFCSMNDISRSGLEGAKYVFTPPVREPWNQNKLWEGLRTNSLQVVSTDHCPFLLNEKMEGARINFSKIPNGGPGIEHRLQLLFDRGVSQKRITLNRWVELTSTNPAKLFGMYPQKGAIEVGSDADIVIWDPNQEQIISAATHHMRVDYSMYEGMKVKGNAETVISRGEIIVEKGRWLVVKGRGRFVKRSAHSNMWKE
jgi:dihydropyrimidinase